MDVFLIGSLSILLVFLLVVVFFIVKIQRDNSGGAARVQELLAQQAAGAQRPQAAPRVAGGRRVGGGRRGAGLRRRGGGNEEDSDLGNVDDEDAGGPARPGRIANPWGEDDEDDEAVEFNKDGTKMGAKKLAKMQMKEEKRMAREAELVEREERKQREKDVDARRKKEEEDEEREEEARLEKERLEREEKERKEQEEYEAMKAAFAVEEEGYDENETLDSDNLLQEFVQYVQDMKVVNMDELASHFKLKTPEVVERIRTMVDEGQLTGLIDDRGKFIYVTQDELNGVAKFLNQRGRVSVTELAEYSNKLIKLEPKTTKTTTAA